MKRSRSLSRRSYRARRNTSSVYAPQCLEDRSLMALVLGGSEFLVNTQVSGEQQTSDAASSVHANADGDFLVVFSGEGAADSQGVFARRYQADGSAVTAVLPVNGTTVGFQGTATAALGSDRGVVVWSGRGNGDSHGIFAAVVTAGGSGAEIAVNVSKAGTQESPAVAMAEDGSFVVAWAGPGSGDRHGIYIRQFAADGTPLSGEVRVNSDASFLQRDPAIAMNADGQFVVTWSSLGQDGEGWGVFGRRFNATLVPQGGELQANTTTQQDQTEARAAIAEDGSYVIAWAGQTASAGGWAVFAQRFAANGSRLGSEVQVNTAPLNGKPELDIASSPDGRYVVTWATGVRTGTGPGVFAQAFLADGTPDGGEFRVNTTRVGRQVAPSVSLDRLGNAVFAWSGMGTGDSSGVFAAQLDSNRDTTAPVITAGLTSTVAGDGTVEEVKIGGTVADATNAVTQIQVKIDDVGQFVDVRTGADLRGDYELTEAQIEQALGSISQGGVLPGGQLPAGHHTIHVRAEDEAGNFSAIVDVPFRLDLPPTIVAGLANNTGTSNTDDVTTDVTISGNITDLGPVTNLKASVDGSAFGDVATGSTSTSGEFTTTTFTLTQATMETLLGGQIADGQHTVRLQATDAKGDTSAVVPVTFTLDTTPPTLTTPLADLAIFEDSADLPLDMSGSFSGNGLTFSVTANTNPRVIQTRVEDNNVVLDFLENRFGEGTQAPLITVRATEANGLFVEDSFVVDVLPANDNPTTVSALRNVTIARTASAPERVIALGGAFADADDLGTMVQFQTSLGNINVELFDASTPITVQNFLRYATDNTTQGGDYNDSIFHRSARSPQRLGDPFVIQGGGFKNVSTDAASVIATDGTITNEPGFSNYPGTLAMARSSGVNSATSQWFFNISDNDFLDRSNQGFAVFGRIVGDGMTVVDGIADLFRAIDDPNFDPPGGSYNPSDDPFPGQNTSLNDDLANLLPSVFNEVPLRNYTFTNPPVSPTADQLVRVNRVVVDPLLSGGRGGDNGLTYTFTNSDPDLIQNLALNGSRQLTYTINQSRMGGGTANITVRATDPTGAFVQQSFSITVTGSPLMLAGDGSQNATLPSAEEIASFNPRPLSPEMEQLVRAAVARWTDTGLNSDLVSRLSQVSFQLADLPGSMLGLATSDAIWLDADAGSEGWFLDSSPADDLEFVQTIAGLKASSGGAEGGVDLLTVAAHELGHVLGLPDLDSVDGLMSDSLDVGVRRLPSADLVDAAFAHELCEY